MKPDPFAYKQAHDKKGIAESLQNHCKRVTMAVSEIHAQNL